jgi:hypothetical protein
VGCGVFGFEVAVFTGSGGRVVTGGSNALVGAGPATRVVEAVGLAVGVCALG